MGDLRVRAVAAVGIPYRPTERGRGIDTSGNRGNPHSAGFYEPNLKAREERRR